MYPPRSVKCADPDIAAGVWSDTTTQDVTGLPRSNKDGVPGLVRDGSFEESALRTLMRQAMSVFEVKKKKAVS